MKIHLESTTRTVEVSGYDCRVWEGTTERGVKIIALIPRIAVPAGEDTAQFEAELQEQRPPSTNGNNAFPLRMVL